MKSLASLPCGQAARVVGFATGCDQTFKRQLMSMGVLPNSILKVVRVAPLKDPIEFEVRDYRLVVRLADAQHVQVECL